MRTDKVTRFEVIDFTSEGVGRVLVRYGVNVEVDIQDDGRTMKVFLRDGEPFVTDMRGWNDRQS